MGGRTKHQDENQANGHLTQELITQTQRASRLNKNRLCKKELMESLQTEQRNVKEMVSEKEASNWITALLLNRFGFRLKESEFSDGL